MADGYLISPRDWPDFRRLMHAFRTGEFLRTKKGPSSAQPAGRPLLRVILLEKLERGKTAAAAVCQPEEANTVQEVLMTGTPSGGQWALLFNDVETDLLPWNPTADELRLALEALPDIDPGDIVVWLGRDDDYFPGVWCIEFRGQYAGQDVPLLQVRNDSVTDTGILVRQVPWKPNGKSEDVGVVIPIDDDFAPGSICTVGWHHGYGYAVVGRECRTFAAPADYGS